MEHPIKPNNYNLVLLAVFFIGITLIAIPPLYLIFSNYNSSISIYQQTLTLVTLVAGMSVLIVTAGLAVAWVTGTYMNSQVRRAEVRSYAYQQVAEEYDWKIRVTRHARQSQHPPLAPTEVDPRAKITPFVPLKPPKKQSRTGTSRRHWVS